VNRLGGRDISDEGLIVWVGERSELCFHLLLADFVVGCLQESKHRSVGSDLASHCTSVYSSDSGHFLLVHPILARPVARPMTRSLERMDRVAADFDGVRFVVERERRFV